MQNRCIFFGIHIKRETFQTRTLDVQSQMIAEKVHRPNELQYDMLLGYMSVKQTFLNGIILLPNVESAFL